MDEKQSIYIVKVEGTGTLEILEGPQVLAVAFSDPPGHAVVLHIQVTTANPSRLHFSGDITQASVKKWEPRER